MSNEQGWTMEHRHTTSQQWAMHDQEVRTEVELAAMRRIKQYKADYKKDDKWEQDILDCLFGKVRNKKSKGL